MNIQAFFDPRASADTRFDEADRIHGAVDPVIDLGPARGKTWSKSEHTFHNPINVGDDLPVDAPPRDILRNACDGQLPAPEESGLSYLTLRLNAFRGSH